MSERVFLNGRILPAAEARVSVFDAGLTHAAGLFETMRAYGGRVMRLEDHIQRLARSAATLDVQIQVDADVLTQAVADVLEANKLTDARLRLTMTPGNVPRQGAADPAPREPTVLLTAGPPATHPPELYEKGMRVCICPYKQNRFDPTAGHKTLAYLPRLLAMKHAAERQCHEALWFNTENQLAEGSVSNVFIVRDDELVTPPPATPVLPGIVRKVVLEIAPAAGIRSAERTITIDDLLAAREVFLTGSVTEIMPVTAIEKHVVGDGVPGEVAVRLRKLYSECVKKECAGDG